jgi:hypothetical protein
MTVPVALRVYAMNESRAANGAAQVQIIEQTPQRLVLGSASTTLTLDKTAGTASLQRKMAFWELKPVERPLAEIASASVDTSATDRPGVEISNTVLTMRGGEDWILPNSNKQNAENSMKSIREFLGLDAG